MKKKRDEALRKQHCLSCDILFEVQCGNLDCGGHDNERWGYLCCFCATRKREEPPLHVLPLPVSGLSDFEREMEEN